MKFRPREFWRDIETLGSFTFYAAVIARSLVGLGWQFFAQLLAALVLGQVALRVLGSATKTKISSHGANGGALLVLINIYYHSLFFLLFSIPLFLLVCVAHKILRRHSWEEIVSGLVLGIASAGIAWFFIPFFV